jgi:hypothetical protein
MRFSPGEKSIPTYTTPMSIKDEIFTWREKHPHATKEQFYAAFKDHNRNTIRTYWNLFTPNISPDIYLTNLDTNIGYTIVP